MSVYPKMKDCSRAEMLVFIVLKATFEGPISLRGKRT